MTALGREGPPSPQPVLPRAGGAIPPSTAPRARAARPEAQNLPHARQKRPIVAGIPFASQSTDPRAPFYEPPNWHAECPWLHGVTSLSPDCRISPGDRRRLARTNARVARKAFQGAWEAVREVIVDAAGVDHLPVARVLLGPDVTKEERDPLTCAPPDVPPGSESSVSDYLESKTTTNSENLSEGLAGQVARGVEARLERRAAADPEREKQARARLEAAAEERMELMPLVAELRELTADVRALAELVHEGGKGEDPSWEPVRVLRAEVARRRRRIRLLCGGASRLATCGRHGQVGICPEDATPLLTLQGDAVWRGSRCEKLGCPECEAARSAMRASMVLRKVKLWQRRELQQAKRENRGARTPKHLVLTAPNLRGESLAESLTRKRAYFSTLRASAEWKRYVRGYTVRWEIKWNDVEGWWHVHAHLLIVGEFWPKHGRFRIYDDTDPTIVGRFAIAECTDEGELLPGALCWEPGLIEAWESAAGGPAGCDISALTTTDAVREVCKYVVKPAVYTDEQRTEIVRATLGKRLFETGGCLRLKEPLSSEQPEDELTPACACCARVFPALREVFWMDCMKVLAVLTRRLSSTGPPSTAPPRQGTTP